MPRRRVSKGRQGTSSSSRSGGKKDSSIQRWKAREDIPLDEVDQFHEQRDKILLEGDDAMGASDDADEEVFALKGLAESSDEVDDELDEEEEDDDDNENIHYTEQRERRQRKGKTDRPSKKVPQSSSEDEEGEESWGRKKSVFYSSNAAQLDSDDEEGHEMEEKEAIRLQNKLRESLRDDDFGFTDALQTSLDFKDSDDFWKPVVAKSAGADATDRISRLRLLQKTSPEALALAQEWEDVAKSVVKTERDLFQLIPSDPAVASTMGMMHLHHQTQMTYAALLAFYLHLRASDRYSSRPELLRQHPILKRLLVLKQSLATLEDLSFNLSDSGEDYDSDEFDDDLDLGDDDQMLTSNEEMRTWLASRAHRLDVGELEQLLAESALSVKEPKRSRETERPPKKKRKTEKSNNAPVFDVEEPSLFEPSKTTASIVTSDGFGEATALDLADVADKGVRRKALRFHTAKIESVSARRQGARNALGGDDDIPYRERRRQMEKQLRKNLGEGGDDLDATDPEQVVRGKKRGRVSGDDEGGSGSEDDDGYYSLVKSQKAAKKAIKKGEYEATKGANRIESTEEVADGQRGITRAILKNKGLTPSRSKSVRNPRVKKRQKFEKAKKKLASQKATYKGGIGDVSHYDGEKSGISRVVKSIKM